MLICKAFMVISAAFDVIANGVQCVAEGANIAGFAKWPTRC